MRASRRNLLLTCVIASLAVVASAPALGGGFVWDDTLLIANNPDLASGEPSYFWSPFFPESAYVGHLYGAIVRPVVKLEHYALYQAFGPTPLPFHLLNLALHVACIALAFRWLARRFPGAPSEALALGLIVFALHPSRVESVAWISGSPDLWMALFVLMGVEAAWSARRGVGPWVGACTALACLSKESAFALAPWLFWEHRSSGRAAAARATVAGAGLAAVALGSAALASKTAAAAGPLSQPAWTPLAALGHQLRDIVWPWSPTFNNPIATTDGAQVVTPFLEIALGAALLVAVAGAAVWARKSRWGPTLAGDLAWFLLPLAPTLIAPSYSPRFLYLPMLGVAAMVVRAARGARGNKIPAVRFATVLAAASLTLVSFRESRSFEDAASLWRAQYARQPDNPLVLDNYGKVLEASGDVSQARRVFAEGVSKTVAPVYARKHLHLALHVMRLEALRASEADQEELHDLLRAFEQLDRGGRLELRVGDLRVQRGFDRADLEAELSSVHLFRFPFALTLARTGNLTRAIALLQAITGNAPGYSPAWTTLVLCQARRFDFGSAQETLAVARRFLPPESAAQLERTIQRAQAILAPDPASVVNRARALLELGAPQLARMTLGPTSGAVDPAVVYLAMRIEISDGSHDRAEQILEAAKAAAPDVPQWADLQRALDQARARDLAAETEN